MFALEVTPAPTPPVYSPPDGGGFEAVTGATTAVPADSSVLLVIAFAVLVVGIVAAAAIKTFADGKELIVFIVGAVATVAFGVLAIVALWTGVGAMNSGESARSATDTEQFREWANSTYAIEPSEEQVQVLLSGGSIAAEQFGVRIEVHALESGDGLVYLFGPNGELARVSDLPPDALAPVDPPPSGTAVK